MIALDTEEQQVSYYDKVIDACNCCSGKCSNNEQPADVIELSEINQQNVPLEVAASSGSPEEVGDIVMVDENPSIVKGNVTPMPTIY